LKARVFEERTVARKGRRFLITYFLVMFFALMGLTQILDFLCVGVDNEVVFIGVGFFLPL
jgi:hypothetical protein